MILRGAATVFAERGVRAASVEDILGAAEISRRTFYRLYASKEEVMVSLYRLGTDLLLEKCRAAVAQEEDLLRQVEGCIDAHLGNARDFGRLIFVLGGEAQRPESLLYARRIEVHETLVSLIGAGLPKKTDRLLLRTIIIALEAVISLVLREGDEGRQVSEQALRRAKRVMVRIATASLTGTGPRGQPRR
jgi:AcrR family transcriptional regulator